MAASLPPKKTPLPSGSGFTRLIRKRADTNNLPGRQNAFGDRILTGYQRNTQTRQTGGRGPLALTTGGNSRAGMMFRTGTTDDGRTVHLYQNGERVVLPKKKKSTFKY
jgi:hypothetical protein